VAAQSAPIDAVLDARGRTQFGIADILRRAQGHAFGAFGLNPNECRYQVICLGSILVPSRLHQKRYSTIPAHCRGSDQAPVSLLSHFSALESSETFIWSRLTDAALSVTDSHAMEIHARVERWALDEISLPGKLIHQLIEWLYRENFFAKAL
jgi:hypothetical protein